MHKIITVNSAGENVAVCPGWFKITIGEETTFSFKNNTVGAIRIMFLQDDLLQVDDHDGWSPVPKDRFFETVADGDQSRELALAQGALAGDYDYVVVFAKAALEDAVNLRGGADSGVAIGGSSPRIIIKAQSSGSGSG